jgi:glutamate-ammonia-ligase adenylyltransferase
MLRRVNAEIAVSGPWDVKHCVGGMIELAFIAEALQLIFGPGEQKLFRANTAAAIKGLAAAGHLAAGDAKRLVKADFLWRTIQGIARITGLKDKDSSPPAAMIAPLLRATGTADLAALRARMSEAGDDVRACFDRVIGGGAGK